MAHINRERSLVKQTSNPNHFNQQCAQIARYYESLARTNYGSAATKHALAQADSMREAWAAVNVPANREQIAIAIGKLLACFPNLGRDARDIFARQLCEDVAAEKPQPSLFVVETMCRTIRTECKFPPSIAEVITAIKEAQKQARRTNGLMKSLPKMQQQLLEYESPEAVAEREEYRIWWEAQERARLQKKIEQGVWPEWFDEDDLKLLGISRRELERRLDERQHPRKASNRRGKR